MATEKEVKVVEIAKEKVIEKVEPPKGLSLEDVEKRIEDALAKKDLEYQEKLTASNSEFEAKLAKIGIESKEKEDILSKVIEGLKEDGNKDDIIKEIEENNKKKDEARVALEKEQVLADLNAKLLASEKEKEDIIAKGLEAERINKLNLEKSDFKSILKDDQVKKPWLAEKIDKIFETEDYAEQKSEYRMLMKFFDTATAEDEYKAKEKAGASAFEGVKSSANKSDKKDFNTFNQEYLNKIIGR